MNNEKSLVKRTQILEEKLGRLEQQTNTKIFELRHDLDEMKKISG